MISFIKINCHNLFLFPEFSKQLITEAPILSTGVHLCSARERKEREDSCEPRGALHSLVFHMALNENVRGCSFCEPLIQ